MAPASEELRQAAHKGDLARLLTLLSTATNDVIDGVDDDDWTALHFAAFMGETACLEALLAAGADIEAKSQRGSLHHAAAYRNTACLEVLLANGANIEARTNEDKTALDIAREREDTDAVRRGPAVAAADDIDHQIAMAMWQEQDEVGQHIDEDFVDEWW